MNHSFGGCVFSPPHKTTSVTTTSIDLLLIVEPKKQKDEVQFFKEEPKNDTQQQQNLLHLHPGFCKKTYCRSCSHLSPDSSLHLDTW